MSQTTVSELLSYQDKTKTWFLVLFVTVLLLGVLMTGFGVYSLVKLVAAVKAQDAEKQKALLTRRAKKKKKA
jgi:ABC-type thiamin/hydroxymethylpyrimidine transport system permease subunit